MDPGVNPLSDVECEVTVALFEALPMPYLNVSEAVEGVSVQLIVAEVVETVDVTPLIAGPQPV